MRGETMKKEATGEILLLWQRLTSELAGVYDAHGVCAAAADEIARLTGATTVVALRDLLNPYYDVWVTDANGRTEQARWDGDQAVSLARLVAGDQVVRQEKLKLDAGELIHSELWLLARECLLFAPISGPGNPSQVTPPGAICLMDPKPDCPLNESTIQSLAAFITVVLDRAFLRRRSDQQTIEFGIVSDISYSTSSTLHLEEIFYQVADAVRRTLNAESISIGLMDPVSGEIVFVDTLMGPLFRDLPPIRLKPGQGIGGWVAEHGAPLIVNNAYADQRFFTKVDRDSGFQTHSILCVPLQVESRVIGILEAINKQNGHFNEDDLRLLQAISGPLAVAIENARLHTDVLSEKRRIETIFASMSEGMLTVNKEGWVTAANESLLTLLQRKADQLAGQPASEIIETTPAHFRDFMENVLAAKQESPQLACELKQGNDEYVPILISGTPIVDEEDNVLEAIFVFSDLRQIREVERMRDDFFNNIIHELRTPLATILMYARLLREGKARNDGAKADRFLGVIERESDRLQRMVRQMLQLVKLEAREIQRSSEIVNLKNLFDQILPPLADQATEKGLAFSQRLATSLPDVIGSEETLYIVFKNLVENAIKFTFTGTVRVEANVKGGMISVQISDEGIGIPEHARPNLFKRFYRTQTAVERGIAGTGLGLYMVKEGVEKHNGTIDVKSTEGKGTTFIVRLPVAPG
jgi:signal transduction histidine kinase/putative methionine-R-sulfoxide reductase with GAF domain